MSAHKAPNPWEDVPESPAGFPAPQPVPPPPAPAPQQQVPQSQPYPPQPQPTWEQHQQQAAFPTPIPADAATGIDRTTRAEDLLQALDRNTRELERPESGFRRFLYDMSGGRVNPGLSRTERERRDLVHTIASPLPPGKVYRIGFYSQKGGVGKSSTTAAVGAILAMCRTDKVLALDVNPDGGSLGIRVPRTTPATILDLRDALSERELSPMEFDGYVNRNPKTRLDSIVLPPGEKPSHPLSAGDYDMIAAQLQQKYPYKVILIDCGTDLTSSIMDGVIPSLDLMVNITTTKRDEGAVTLGGLDALADDGNADLVSRSITLVINKEPKAPDVQMQRKLDSVAQEVRNWFADATSAVIDIPYDFAISSGEVIDPQEISPDGTMAYMRASAHIIESLRAHAGAGPR